MASQAINWSAVSVTSATGDAHRTRRKGSQSIIEIESNSTTKGKASGMTLQGKGKRTKTLELHAGRIQSHAEDTSANHTLSCEEIRLRAYEIYLERGGHPSNEMDDWLQAERELERAAPSKANGF
jgi:hypothetical protein